MAPLKGYPFWRITALHHEYSKANYPLIMRNLWTSKNNEPNIPFFCFSLLAVQELLESLGQYLLGNPEFFSFSS